MNQLKQLKILIIRFSSIGDIVLTTPVIRCLRLQLHAEIHYLTKKTYKGILTSNPYVNKVWTIEKEVTEIQSALKEENFDYIIDLHKNLRTLRLKTYLQKKSFSFNKLNIEKWLMVNLKINRLPNIHIVDRYLETVKSLNIKNDGKGLDYFIPEKDAINLVELLIEEQPNVSVNNQKTRAFVIGAAHATKRLPTKKISSICNEITKATTDLILLLGGPDDVERSLEIIKHTDKNVINLCGKLNLNQSASVIQQVDEVITHDTGLMHIAAAFQKKITSVWGNTIPEFGMYPYLNETQFKILEIKGLACRPCSKIGHQKCPKGHFNCMELMKEKDFI
jgi:ADP-heptose:LPS heptosyltransferase